MDLKSKVEKLEKKLKHQGKPAMLGVAIADTKFQDTKFQDYMQRILNAKEGILTDSELAVKKGLEKFTDISNTNEIERIIRVDKALEEGLFEIMQKVKANENFESNRGSKEFREKLNKEFQETINFHKRFDEEEKRKKALYKAQSILKDI